MQISKLLPARASAIVPLLRQLHSFHLAQESELLQPEPTDDELTNFLMQWLRREGVTALIAGPVTTPHAYLIFEIENRSGSILTKPECRAMLHHICVDARHRREGLGSALITEMKVLAKAQKVDRIGTTYAQFNTASAALMASNGLTPRRTYASIEFADL